MLARRCELESVVSAAGSGHGVVAGVDVDGFAGDGPGEVGEQEADGVGDGGRVVGVPGQRGGGGPGVQEPIDARYGVGGTGVEGPAGAEVEGSGRGPGREIGDASGRDKVGRYVWVWGGSVT